MYCLSIDIWLTVTNYGTFVPRDFRSQERKFHGGTLAILRGPVPNYFIYTSYEIAHVASSSHLRCKWTSRVRV